MSDRFAKARALIDAETALNPDLQIDRLSMSAVLLILDAYFLLGTYEGNPEEYRERVHAARREALERVTRDGDP